MTTLVYIGNFGLDYATENHLARDAEALGHTVRRVQEPNGGDPRQFFDALERASGDADLVLYTKTYGLPDIAEQVWRRIEARGTQTASFHLDLYYGLPRQVLIGKDPFWKTGTVFTADGDANTAAYMEAQNVNHRWLPPAVVSDETAPGEWRDEFDFDVVFAGSRTYHPAWPWRPKLIDGLERRYGERFHHFNRPQIRGRDLNDLYASARVVVGDSLCLPGHSFYWSDRYFETIGRGGFLIAPDVPGLYLYLEDGEHFIGYPPGDLATVCHYIDDYLSMDDERSRIAKQGHEHVSEHHTYRQRVTEMLDVLGCK